MKNKPTVVSNIKGNSMGTTSFDMLLPDQRKAQDFITYPIDKNDPALKVKIQSDKRIGYLHLATGKIEITKSFAGGAYNHHLMLTKLEVFQMEMADVDALRAHIRGTASPMAGNNGLIYSDNSNAALV